MRPLFAGLLLALSLPAAAQVYSYTDANGNLVYTSEPPQGSNAQSVDLPPTNGASAPAPANMAQPVQDSGTPASESPPSYNAAPAPQTQVTISPNDDSADDDTDGYNNTSDNDTPRRDERDLRQR